MSLDTLAIGAKLKRCRENLMLEVEEVTLKIGIPLSRLLSMENGQIEPSGDEILILADFYKQDFKFFISNEGLSASEQVETLYRKFGSEFSKEDRLAIQEFLFLCENEEEVLVNLEYPRRKFVYHSNSQKIYKEQGIKAARDLRSFLGYSGKALYQDIFSDFRKIGMHIFRRKLSNSNISGLYINHPTAGNCILVNLDEDTFRQNFTVTHEVAHAILDSNRQYNVSFNDDKDYREYRANSFAGSFLVPEEIFKHQTFTSLTKDIVISLSKHLKVNPQVVLIALKEYGVISKSDSDAFMSVKLPIAEKQDFELSKLTPKRQVAKNLIIQRGLSDFYVNNCYEAYGKGFISAGKLAEMLLSSESELTEILNLFNLKLEYEY